jgi:hypothetical protein
VTVIEKSEVFDGADQATLHAEIGNPLLGLAKKNTDNGLDSYVERTIQRQGMATEVFFFN